MMRIGYDHLPHHWQWNIVVTLVDIFSLDRPFDSGNVAAELVNHPRMVTAMTALGAHLRPAEAGITGCLDAIVATNINFEGVKLVHDPLGYRVICGDDFPKDDSGNEPLRSPPDGIWSGRRPL